MSRGYKQGPMRRAWMVDRIAEALLTKSHAYGGGPDEWELSRERTRMSRIKLAHVALLECERSGMLPPSFVTSSFPFDDQGQMYYPESNEWAYQCECDICGELREGDFVDSDTFECDTCAGRKDDGYTEEE